MLNVELILLFVSSLGFILTGSGGCRTELKHYRLSQSDHFEVIRRSIPLFENKTLTVSVLVREPFVYFNRKASRETGREEEASKDLNNYSGVAIEVIKRLSVIFKFKIDIVVPADKEFGVLKGNKTWSGVVGSLVRNQSDVGVTALSITVARSEVVDFTRAYYVETGAILLPIPEEVQNYFAVMEPFSPGVWLCLFIIIILLIVLIAIMTKLEEDQREQHKLSKVLKVELKARKSVSSNSKHLEDKLRNLRENHKASTWLERIYYAITCVLNILLIRDIKNPPKQTPIRILVCIWWLSTIVIVNIYLGILFGQLVVPRRPKSIETLEELVNQSKVEWCVTTGSALDMLFRRSSLATIYGQVGLRMRNVPSADEGVERVLKQGSAFIRERSMLTFKVAQEHNRLRACKVQISKAEFFSVGFGLALPKGSNYLKPFNSALTLMIENGFLSHWQSIYWPTRNQFTECKFQTDFEPLSMKHFISIWSVSSLAIAVSALILVYQNVHERVFRTKLFQPF